MNILSLSEPLDVSMIDDLAEGKKSADLIHSRPRPFCMALLLFTSKHSFLWFTPIILADIFPALFNNSRMRSIVSSG
jgi:hypothetical protein